MSNIEKNDSASQQYYSSKNILRRLDFSLQFVIILRFLKIEHAGFPR